VKMMKDPLPEDEIRIEPMQTKDVEEVHAIESRSFRIPWSAGTFYSELLENQFAYYLVAKKGQTLVGYGGMWIILDEAHITNVAVLPEYRGRGLGRRLLRALMDSASSEGARKMTLEVRPSNERALTLYKKHGFVIRGVRKAYYQGEDAYIMWKDDLTP
jgi:[ribosomal protein S18]-alanine N-acetyltransferase